MAEEKQSTSYGNIFKTTFLFGFVQVIKAVISIVINKMAAILIGPNGMGLLGIYNSTISLVQTGASLGLNQSAVRDVAEANGTGDINKRDRVINVTLKVVLGTGLLGFLITICLSYFISDWTMGDHSHTYIYCILAIVISLNIVNDGRQAVLKGMRLMRYLAIASIIGSVTSLFVSIPLYYVMGKEGIVPALLLSSASALLVSNFFIKKINIKKVTIPVKDLCMSAIPMVKIGTVLMFVTFLQTIISFCINSFVRKEGGIEDVGFYSTGQYILSGYFGLVITALMTDYYPRIAAVNNNNKQLTEELNKQILVTLILCCPMFAIFVVLLPVFIELLYTSDFLPVVDYIKVAIFGTLMMSISNPCDMLFVVKQESKILVVLAVLVRGFQLISSYVLYINYGLFGLGLSFLLVITLHSILVFTIAYKKYAIVLNKQIILFLLVIIVLLILAGYFNNFSELNHRILFSAILLSLFIALDILAIKRIMGINIGSFVRRILHKQDEI